MQVANNNLATYLKHFRLLQRYLKRSGLQHRHLVNGMDATILTSLLRPMFTVHEILKKLVTCIVDGQRHKRICDAML